MGRKSKVVTSPDAYVFPIDTFRVSEKAKVQLINLKRNTGIENWNILCRWAFCLSLAEPKIPPTENIIANSSIEMDWKTFGGIEEDAYKAALLTRVMKDFGTADHEVVVMQFRLHLHRGIGYLASMGIRSIFDLLSIAIK